MASLTHCRYCLALRLDVAIEGYHVIQFTSTWSTRCSTVSDGSTATSSSHSVTNLVKPTHKDKGLVAAIVPCTLKQCFSMFPLRHGEPDGDIDKSCRDTKIHCYDM